jgi:hypothetical protein
MQSPGENALVSMQPLLLTLLAPDCRPARELLEMGLSSYFKEGDAW